MYEGTSTSPTQNTFIIISYEVRTCILRNVRIPNRSKIMDYGETPLYSSTHFSLYDILFHFCTLIDAAGFQFHPLTMMNWLVAVGKKQLPLGCFLFLLKFCFAHDKGCLPFSTQFQHMTQFHLCFICPTAIDHFFIWTKWEYCLSLVGNIIFWCVRSWTDT